MGDHHPPEAKIEALSAKNTSAARRTAALAGDAAAKRIQEHAGDAAVKRIAPHAAYRYEGSVHHAAASVAMPSRRAREDTVPVPGTDERGKLKKSDSPVPVVLDRDTAEVSSAGNTAAAGRSAAHAGEDEERGAGRRPQRPRMFPTRPEEGGEEEVYGGDEGFRRRRSSHVGATAARTVANRDEQTVRHEAASGADTIPLPAADEQSLDRDGKKRPGAPLESVSGLINKTAIAAVGGEMPAILRLAADKEAIKAAAPRMEAMARKNQMAGGLPKPSPVPVQRRLQPQPQQQPQPQSDPLLQLKGRPLLQPDRSCPRCHTSMGSVAPHHLCRCVHCSKSEEVCPFCCLATLPKMECARGMCPSCGTRAGKEKLDHICSCEACKDCPRCTLAKLPRPLPRWNGACPCCLENAGNASSHLCLCLKCKLVPGSACPFCALCEPPCAVKPFDYIRIEAYSLK